MVQLANEPATAVAVVYIMCGVTFGSWFVWLWEPRVYDVGTVTWIGLAWLVVTVAWPVALAGSLVGFGLYGMWAASRRRHRQIDYTPWDIRVERRLDPEAHLIDRKSADVR
jgi:hypothetical protein